MESMNFTDLLKSISFMSQSNNDCCAKFSNALHTLDLQNQAKNKLNSPQSRGCYENV